MMSGSSDWVKKGPSDSVIVVSKCCFLTRKNFALRYFSVSAGNWPIQVQPEK